MIVVTGGAGFIGSVFLRFLNERGIDDILVVDELLQGEKWMNLVGKRYRDILHKDVFRSRMLSGAFDDTAIEAVFHLGACSTTTERNADYLLDNNYEYSKDVALWCARRGIRLVYASSAATYGNGENGYADTESHSLRPLNMYGYSKHIFDLWLARHTGSHNAVGLKFFNVFGPNEYHKGDMASLVYKSFFQVRDQGVIRLFKSYRSEYPHGGQKRDFVYVKDAVRVMWELYANGEAQGVFNLGTGVARSWNDLASAVFYAMGLQPNIEYIDMPESLRGQYQYFTQADMSSAEKVVPNLAFSSLEDAVRDYVVEHLQREINYY